MTKVLCTIQPFMRNQSIYVMKGHDKELIAESPTDMLAESIVKVSKELNVSDVLLIGRNEFTFGIKQKIEILDISHYSENKIKVDVI